MIPLQQRIIERMHTLEEFERAYEGLGDALLKHVALAYTQESQPQITVVLECMSALVDYEWVKLEIRFSGVQEFNIVSKRHHTLVVVESFAANRIEDVFVFDFAPTIIPPETMEEHRQSWFYIACASFDCREIERSGR
jgi:hypothetical protein